jgi:hypothetical protein
LPVDEIMNRITRRSFAEFDGDFTGLGFHMFSCSVISTVVERSRH